MGVFVDSDASKVFFYRNGVPLDDVAAFNNIPVKQELFPFITMTHPGATASISFKPLPAQKPPESGIAGAKIHRFTTRWSLDKMSSAIGLKNEARTAEIRSMGVQANHQPKDISVSRPVSVCAKDKFPVKERTYVEVRITSPGRNSGASLQGGFYVGVCSTEFKSWDGLWEWDQETRSGVWALHDSYAARSGEITQETFVRRQWNKEKAMHEEVVMGYGSAQQPSGHTKPLPGFGAGDRMGLLVEFIDSTPKDLLASNTASEDADTSLEQEKPKQSYLANVMLYKNGKRKGYLATDIRAKDLWVFVSMSPHEGATAELLFPPMPADAMAQHSEGPDAEDQEEIEHQETLEVTKVTGLNEEHDDKSTVAPIPEEPGEEEQEEVVVREQQQVQEATATNEAVTSTDLSDVASQEQKDHGLSDTG
mmetsp:Transcript_5245/g.8400  ORF Transcript_5245/g.8400 Transcript_5245/m.8400 type:complete len:422 (-) Transcript_5245:790-2055(-)